MPASAALGPFLTLLRWDIALELRRPVATLNMVLLALLLLFIGSYAESAVPQIRGEFGPIFFWMVILFAGTVGLSRAFLIEQENNALAGILVAPVEAGLVYLAKAASTWLYVMIMELLVLGAYVLLFDARILGGTGALLGLMAAFSYVYVAAGTVLSAMTTSLRSGELLLRILLFPLMIPSIMFAMMSVQGTFIERPVGAAGLGPNQCALALVSMGTIYLLAGYLLFPKVVEE